MAMFFGRKPKRMDARKGRAARIGAAAPKRGPGFRIPAHAVLVGLLFIVATSLVIIAGGQVMPWREGQRPWQEIRVRQPFSVLDQEATERARREAQESTPNYYRLNQSLLGQIERDLTGLYNDLRATELNDRPSTPDGASTNPPSRDSKPSSLKATPSRNSSRTSSSCAPPWPPPTSLNGCPKNTRRSDPSS